MKSSKSVVLGVDVGTTSISIAVVDLESGRNLLAQSALHGAGLAPDVPGAHIQDPELLFACTAGLVDRSIAAWPNIQAIGVTGQMHGVIPVDADGDPTGPAYTWLDQRARPYQDAIAEELGTTIPTGYGAATLYALVRGDALARETSAVAPVPAWIAGRLVGARTYPSSAGLAHSMGLFSPERHGFHAESWARIGAVPPPPVGADATFIGTTRKGVPVSLPEGDNQTSFLATVRDPERAISFNIGTSGQVTVQAPEHRFVTDTSGLEERPLPGGRSILVGATLSGGKSFEIVTGLLQDIASRLGTTVDDPFELLECLEKPDDAPLVSTTFEGTRRDPTLRGSFLNVGLGNFTLEHLYWGIARGVVDELMQLLGGHVSLLDMEESYVTASGNALRRSVALQRCLSASVHGRVRWQTESEAAARGAAFLAGAALAGGVSELAELRRTCIRYTPRPA